MMTRWFARAATRQADLPTARQMSKQDHVRWWAGIVAAFSLGWVLSDRLGTDTWAAHSVKGSVWFVVLLYSLVLYAPASDRLPRTVRGHAWSLAAFALFVIGFGYVASR